MVRLLLLLCGVGLASATIRITGYTDGWCVGALGWTDHNFGAGTGYTALSNPWYNTDASCVKFCDSCYTGGQPLYVLAQCIPEMMITYDVYVNSDCTVTTVD